MAIYTSGSAGKTQEIAQKMAEQFTQTKSRDGAIIALYGEMGTGKTTFIQGFAKGLGVKGKVLSPTFLLMRQYPINSKKTLYHIDLYRLDKINRLDEIGLVEIFNNPNNIILIEWPEKLEHLLTTGALSIIIERLSEFKRRITVPKQLSL